MEEGDKKSAQFVDKIQKISIAEFKKTYERLRIKFDTYLGESYFAGEAEKIIQEALDKKIVFEDPSTGAIAVELGGLPSFCCANKMGPRFI